jgi:peptidoglycan-associated lipoprotein
MKEYRAVRSVWWLLAAAFLAAGCATQTTGELPPVEDRSAGAAETRGVGEAAGREGAALPGDARAAAVREDLLAKRRVHFAFDSSTIDEEGRAIIEAHATHLAANPALKLRLEGHCDERGTREYNLALGERRAQAVERMTRLFGVAAGRITVQSYGEEKPLDPEHNESAWRLNRRVEIIY